MENIEIRDTVLTDGMEVITINKISWTNLPRELLIYICKHLRRGDIQQLRMMCKHWYNSTHFKFIQKSKLIISSNDVAKLHYILQNDYEYRHRLTCDRVEMYHIELNDVSEFILKSLGQNIRTLHLVASPVFAILNDCLPNLEELRIRLMPSVQRDDWVSLNLSKFKHLKALDIKCPSLSSDITNDIMLQLNQNESLKMEKLCVNIYYQQHESLINILQLHSESLKHLEIHFRGYIGNILKLNQAFAMLKHLEVVEIYGKVSMALLSSIINVLPKSMPLRHFCFKKTLQLNLIELVNNKWPGLFENMEFINCNDIYNNHIKNLSTLHHSLRKLVIKYPHHITEHGLLQGIVSETNNVIRTLVFDKPRYCGNQILNMQLLIQRLPNLTNLSLKKNTDGVDDTVLSCIFRHLLNLQHLSLDGCPKITDNGLLGFGSNPAPISNLKDLQSLSLCHCDKITDKSLIECFKFIELRKLTFGYCCDISSEGIKELVKNCPALEELTLSGCSLIDDDSILAIAKGLHRIRRLNVDFCERLTIKCIDYVLEFSRSLRDLSMQGQSDMDYEKAFEKLIRYGICLIHNTKECCFCT